VDKLLKELSDIDAKIDAILAGDGALTVEQKAELTQLEASRTQVEEKIDLAKKAQVRADQRAQLQADADRARVAARRAPAGGRLTDTDLPAGVNPTVPAAPRDLVAEQRLGFASFGEFASEIRRAGMMKAPTPRLLQVYDAKEHAAVIGMNEGISSEGGALVPPEFSAKIMQRLYAQENLLSRCDQYTIQTDSITFPRNAETSRASGSRFGGVRTYWRGEGTAPTATKPGYGKFTLNLHKLIALAGATDELLRDANAAVLEQTLFNVFSEEINFEVNAAIVAGTGSGQPIGIKDAACAVSVAKETGQAAATINAQNIVKMWSRMWAGCRRNAVWLVNQDVEPQLNLMSFGLGTAGVMLYMPPGGLSAAPYATLMGRPVIPVEQAETLGTKGDVILADLSHYAVAMQGGPQTAVSMHLYFDTDQMAFRATFRIDGAPWWTSALTPYKGSATQSCIVTLATRA